MMLSPDLLEGYRLSPQQKRICQLQLDDQSQAYRAQCAVSISGSLDVSRLISALESLLDRHEILRTTFRRLPGIELPIQVISEQGEMKFECLDLSEGQHVSPEELLTQLFEQTLREPLDVEQGPTLHVKLIKLTSVTHLMIIGLPALCGDKTGIKNAVREIVRAYDAQAESLEESSEALQYADLAEFQNELLEAEDTEAGRQYWRKQALDDLPAVRLPFDSSLEETTRRRFDCETEIKLLRDLAPEQLRGLAAQHTASLADLLLACWQTLLWRLTSEAEIFVGVSFDGRNYSELQDALGPFERFIPVGTRLQKGLPFTELLQQVAGRMREAAKRQHYFSWGSPDETSRQLAARFTPICFEYDVLEKYAGQLSSWPLSDSTFPRNATNSNLVVSSEAIRSSLSFIIIRSFIVEKT